MKNPLSSQVPKAEEGALRLVLRSLLTRALEALRATAGEVCWGLRDQM